MSRRKHFVGMDVLTTLAVDLEMRGARRRLPGEVGPSTVTDPHRVELCWVGGQNHGRVSVFPNRAPVGPMIGRVRAGEDVTAVAADYDVPSHQLGVLVRLAEELTAACTG